MAKKSKRYCSFRKIFAATTQEKRRTEQWDVYSAEGNFHLGVVKWFPPWRRYCFFAGRNTLYDPTCLREIADFADAATKTHKAVRQMVKEIASKNEEDRS